MRPTTVKNHRLNDISVIPRPKAEESAFKAFTLIELIIAMGLLAVAGLVFWGLLKTGIWASERGRISAAARENARIALEAITADLRQAAPLPMSTCPQVTQSSLPPAILPAPGGSLVNETGGSEPAAVGCSSPPCVTGAGVSSLNPNIPVLAGSAEQSKDGPSGFLIFSELKDSGRSSPPDLSYSQNPQNYAWVMYQVNPANPAARAPAQLVRYTFPAAVGNACADIFGVASTGTGSGFERIDGTFTLANPGAITEGQVVALSGPQDRIWIMVSQQGASSAVSAGFGGAVYDPTLLNVTVAVSEVSPYSGFGSNLPPLTATLSSLVHLETGGTP